MDLAGVEAGCLEVGQGVAHTVAVVEAVSAPSLVCVPGGATKVIIYLLNIYVTLSKYINDTDTI